MGQETVVQGRPESVLTPTEVSDTLARIAMHFERAFYGYGSAKIAELEAHQKTLVDRIQQITSDNLSLQRDLGAKHQELEHVRTGLRKKEAAFDLVTGAVDGRNARIKNLEEQVARLNNIREGLHRTIDVLNADVKHYRDMGKDMAELIRRVWATCQGNGEWAACAVRHVMSHAAMIIGLKLPKEADGGVLGNVKTVVRDGTTVVSCHDCGKPYEWDGKPLDSLLYCPACRA